jgi:hypothetical protein
MKGEKMKYYITVPEEQETNINIDYFAHELHLYSSKKIVIQRMLASLGSPNKEYFIKNHWHN